MNKDAVRTLGYINMMLDEYARQMSKDDVESLQEARLVLQRLVK